MIVGWTVVAESELDDIWTFIAKDSVDAADRTVQRIRHSARMLCDHPMLGRRGRLNGTRELVVPKLPYILVYRIVEETVEILRAYHTARDWPPL